MIAQSVLQQVTEMLGEYPRLDGRATRTGPVRARGGYGDVYRGIHANSTVVCIKVFRREQVDFSCIESDFVSRFVHEIKVWGPLKHQHVVQFHGWLLYDPPTTEQPTPSLVSNWCKGGNILVFLDRRPDANRSSLIRGIAKGLAYLHSESVVHGDIKPPNVVVDGNGVPQLCDFGTSFVLSQPTIARQTSAKTWRYAAPELFEFGSSSRAAASDVWAYGCSAMQVQINQSCVVY
ncbi:kinase-like domain-containing protein [Cantharellus anzutake]|uniref:kinase-like domain-containing protein n=1 Tax=Cantharellus anzutake TaxID=1750568 RepID=UPI001903E974|nr:kinase-like domain-containing protein [Cantharellus anzutake]KAF8339168.1 kinase-like domain-containing protein [Cantharellus anzutake]